MATIEKKSNNNLWTRLSIIFFAERTQTSRRKVFNTFWAVIFGFIISSGVILISGNNPFLVFVSLITEGATTFGNKLIPLFIAYLISSLAVAICFKAGLFNIGISGQMMAGGFTTLVLFRIGMGINGGSVIVAMITSILAGAAIAVLAGIFKSVFGINEVVSTIMINWIVFFVIKFLVYELNGLSDGDSISNGLSLGYIMPNFFQPQDLNNSWYTNYWNWIIITIGISLVVLIWFVLSKTSFGYKIKMIGLSKTAAEYSGTNKNTLILIVMAISGGMAGFAGFIYYVGIGGEINISEQPLLAGFDAIAISLLVYNNPIGIIFSSLFYGLLTAGGASIPSEFPGMPKEMGEIIIGILVYVAAISVIFTKLNIYAWFRRWIINIRYTKYYKAKKNYVKARIHYIFSWFSVVFKIIKIDFKYEYKWIEAKKWHKNKVNKLENYFIKRYETKKLEIEKMSEEEQIYYFDRIAFLRKEKNTILATYHFFDKYVIKNERKNKFKKAKFEFKKVKESIQFDFWQKHKQYVNIGKGVNDGNI